jgi:proteic killer suppression protein
MGRIASISYLIASGLTGEPTAPVIGIAGATNRNLQAVSDRRNQALFRDERVRQFGRIARVAKRKLEAVNAAGRLEDLTIPPSNRLEKLEGNLRDFHSIRVNDQWRVIFKWINGEPHEVRIVDYH